MLNFESMIDRQLMLFVLLGVGILLARVKLVDDKTRGVISEIVINVLMPCSIVSAFLQAPYDTRLLRSFFVAVGAGFGVHLFSILVARLLYRRQPQGKRAVLQFATISSNAAFIGIPVVGGMYGPEGVLFTAAYLVSMNLFMWSTGLSFFESKEKQSVGKKIKATAKKVVTQPGILAAVLGVVLLVFRVPLPGFVVETISSVGHCTTVFSMLVVGHVMSKVNFFALFTKRNLYFCAVRLVLIPLVTLGVLLIVRPGAMVTGVMVVLAGMPAASATVMVAGRYETQTAFAAQLVSLSTVLSMGTLVLLATLTNFVVQ